MCLKTLTEDLIHISILLEETIVIFAAIIVQTKYYLTMPLKTNCTSFT